VKVPPGPDRNLVPYYAARAAEYERIYVKPERQRDLEALRDWLSRSLHGEAVLEVACGTGYWTEVIAGAAGSVRAVDASPEVLDIARRKDLSPGRVTFSTGDAYRLHEIEGRYTALFAGFFWSHVPRSGLPAFLESCARRVGPGGWMVFIDNRYVEGSSTPISRTDANGNTWQLRRLSSGGDFEILKNFPQKPEVLAAVSHLADEAEFLELTHYWGVRFKSGQ
jgi:demethylmenaquinone methyltransferase/2-methoxy-6-polyprenyl-1,4-benzoquinol methylase